MPQSLRNPMALHIEKALVEAGLEQRPANRLARLGGLAPQPRYINYRQCILRHGFGVKILIGHEARYSTPCGLWVTSIAAE